MLENETERVFERRRGRGRIRGGGHDSIDLNACTQGRRSEQSTSTTTTATTTTLPTLPSPMLYSPASSTKRSAATTSETSQTASREASASVHHLLQMHSPRRVAERGSLLSVKSHDAISSMEDRNRYAAHYNDAPDNNYNNNNNNIPLHALLGCPTEPDPFNNTAAQHPFNPQQLISSSSNRRRRRSRSQNGLNNSSWVPRNRTQMKHNNNNNNHATNATPITQTDRRRRQRGLMNPHPRTSSLPPMRDSVYHQQQQQFPHLFPLSPQQHNWNHVLHNRGHSSDELHMQIRGGGGRISTGSFVSLPSASGVSTPNSHHGSIGGHTLAFLAATQAAAIKSKAHEERWFRCGGRDFGWGLGWCGSKPIGTTRKTKQQHTILNVPRWDVLAIVVLGMMVCAGGINVSFSLRRELGGSWLFPGVLMISSLLVITILASMFVICMGQGWGSITANDTDKSNQAWWKIISSNRTAISNDDDNDDEGVKTKTPVMNTPPHTPATQAHEQHEQHQHHQHHQQQHDARLAEISGLHVSNSEVNNEPTDSGWNNSINGGYGSVENNHRNNDGSNRYIIGSSGYNGNGHICNGSFDSPHRRHRRSLSAPLVGGNSNHDIQKLLHSRPSSVVGIRLPSSDTSVTSTTTSQGDPDPFTSKYVLVFVPLLMLTVSLSILCGYAFVFAFSLVPYDAIPLQTLISNNTPILSAKLLSFAGISLSLSILCADALRRIAMLISFQRSLVVVLQSTNLILLPLGVSILNVSYNCAISASGLSEGLDVMTQTTLTVGVLLLGLSILGVLGSALKSRSLLGAYAIILAGITGVLLSAAVYSFSLAPSAPVLLRDSWTSIEYSIPSEFVGMVDAAAVVGEWLRLSFGLLGFVTGGAGVLCVLMVLFTLTLFVLEFRQCSSVSNTANASSEVGCVFDGGYNGYIDSGRGGGGDAAATHDADGEFTLVDAGIIDARSVVTDGNYANDVYDDAGLANRGAGAERSRVISDTNPADVAVVADGASGFGDSARDDAVANGYVTACALNGEGGASFATDKTGARVNLEGRDAWPTSPDISDITSGYVTGGHGSGAAASCNVTVAADTAAIAGADSGSITAFDDVITGGHVTDDVVDGGNENKAFHSRLATVSKSAHSELLGNVMSTVAGVGGQTDGMNSDPYGDPDLCVAPPRSQSLMLRIPFDSHVPPSHAQTVIDINNDNNNNDTTTNTSSRPSYHRLPSDVDLGPMDMNLTSYNTTSPAAAYSNKDQQRRLTRPQVLPRMPLSSDKNKNNNNYKQSWSRRTMASLESIVSALGVLGGRSSSIQPSTDRTCSTTPSTTATDASVLSVGGDTTSLFSPSIKTPEDIDRDVRDNKLPMKKVQHQADIKGRCPADLKGRCPTYLKGRCPASLHERFQSARRRGLKSTDSASSRTPLDPASVPVTSNDNDRKKAPCLSFCRDRNTGNDVEQEQSLSTDDKKNDNNETRPSLLSSCMSWCLRYKRTGLKILAVVVVFSVLCAIGFLLTLVLYDSFCSSSNQAKFTETIETTLLMNDVSRVDVINTFPIGSTFIYPATAIALLDRQVDWRAQSGKGTRQEYVSATLRHSIGGSKKQTNPTTQTAAPTFFDSIFDLNGTDTDNNDTDTLNPDPISANPNLVNPDSANPNSADDDDDDEDLAVFTLTQTVWNISDESNDIDDGAAQLLFIADALSSSGSLVGQDVPGCRIGHLSIGIPVPMPVPQQLVPVDSNSTTNSNTGISNINADVDVDVDMNVNVYVDIRNNMNVNDVNNQAFQQSTQMVGDDSNNNNNSIVSTNDNNAVARTKSLPALDIDATDSVAILFPWFELQQEAILTGAQYGGSSNINMNVTDIRFSVEPFSSIHVKSIKGRVVMHGAGLGTEGGEISTVIGSILVANSSTNCGLRDWRGIERRVSGGDGKTSSSDIDMSSGSRNDSTNENSSDSFRSETYEQERAVSIHSLSGDIRLTNVAVLGQCGLLNVTSVSGLIDITNMRGAFTPPSTSTAATTTSTGTTDMYRKVSAQVASISNSGGGIQLNHINAQRLQLNEQNGDIKAVRLMVSQNLRVVTTTGDISIGSKQITILHAQEDKEKSGSDDVIALNEIGAVLEADARVHVETQSGNVFVHISTSSGFFGRFTIIVVSTSEDEVENDDESNGSLNGSLAGWENQHSKVEDEESILLRKMVHVQGSKVTVTREDIQVAVRTDYEVHKEELMRRRRRVFSVSGTVDCDDTYEEGEEEENEEEEEMGKCVYGGQVVIYVSQPVLEGEEITSVELVVS